MRDLCTILVLLVVAGGADAAAQTRELELRVDSLARIAAMSRSEVKAYDDSVRTHARAVDTAFAGPPLVTAGREISAETRAMVAGVIDSIRLTTGSALSRLSGYTLRLHVEKHPDWRRPGDTTRELIATMLRPDGTQLGGWRGQSDSASIAQTLRFATTFATFAVASPSLLSWAGSALPTDTLRASDWANLRLLLVSSNTAVADRCYRGDAHACRVALMLAPSGDPVLDWHDSTTRRTLVHRFGAYARRMDQGAVQQCLGGSDSACVAVLLLFPREMFREPTASGLRSGFLRYAVAVGGAGAVERLLITDAVDPMARLEAASQVPIDSLIGSWRARIRETRAPSDDLTFGITIMSLAWVTGMGALSLRSSRWR